GGTQRIGAFLHAINPQGFPGPPVDEPRAPSGFRVLCLGDSSPFGVGADPDRVFARIPEERLAPSLPGRRVEVVNGGVPGYTIAQGLHRLRELLGRLRPDAVVVMFGAMNEQHPAAKLSDEEWIRTLESEPFEGGAFAGTRVGRFLRWVRSGVRRRYVPGTLDELAASGFRVLDAHGEPTLGRRVPPERYGPLLEEACAAAGEDGARVLVIVPPVSPEGPAIRLAGRNLWRRDLYDRICAECREIGRRPGRVLLDAASLFEESGGASLFADDVHPNEAGHARLAEALAVALVSLAAR
ncbi:MAG: SGNH/GDSL hydrolase family protein, partial [Planctomycetota bacterium]